MVVLAQEEGLVLLGLAILITVFVGSICGIVAVRKIAGLREIISRLETAIRVLKDRIAAVEASLRRLTGGQATGPEPVDKSEGAAPSEHERDVWIIEEGVRPEPAAPSVAGPFLASRALRIIHAPGCTHAKRISKKNRQKFDTLDAAFAAGKELCPKCLPPGKPEAEAPPEPAKAGAGPDALDKTTAPINSIGG